MDRDQFGAIGKRSFDLNTVNHAGNSGHDLVATQNLASEVHELSDAFPLANEFKELGRNQGNGFRMVEPDSAGQTLLGYKARVVEQQLVDFSR